MVKESRRSCIYTIRNTENGNEYIGSTSRYGPRAATHKRLLRQGVHHSPALQAAWNKYGECAFVFVILEDVPRDRAALFEAEQRHMDTLKPAYNCLPAAGTALGYKWSKTSPLKGRKRPPKACAAVRAGLRAIPEKLRARRHVIGWKHSAEVLAQRSESQRGMDTSHTRTPEARRKMSLRRAEEMAAMSPEAMAARMAKARAANTVEGRKRGEQKRAETMKKNPYRHTPEVRARMAASIKANWDKRKAAAAKAA